MLTKKLRGAGFKGSANTERQLFKSPSRPSLSSFHKSHAFTLDRPQRHTASSATDTQSMFSSVSCNPLPSQASFLEPGELDLRLSDSPDMFEDAPGSPLMQSALAEQLVPAEDEENTAPSTEQDASSLVSVPVRSNSFLILSAFLVRLVRLSVNVPNFL